MKIIAFTKVNLPYGWLGNMAPFPIAYEGKPYRTTEALFQALRFDQDSIREVIRNEKSPMAAKLQAKHYRDQMVIPPQSTQDVDNMKMVLQLKLSYHAHLQTFLAETGDALIIEDRSRRSRGSGMFWGAALINGEWQGSNVLGQLWMDLRDQLWTAPAVMQPRLGAGRLGV